MLATMPDDYFSLLELRGDAALSPHFRCSHDALPRLMPLPRCKHIFGRRVMPAIANADARMIDAVRD